MGVIDFFKRLFGKSSYPVEKVRILEKKYRKWLETHDLPLPSKGQVGWLDAEFGCFFHFGINSFNNKEWSDGTLLATSFNPKKLDCGQWIDIAQNMGANYAIVTAKHHDGFCLWQTKISDYSVASSPWKNGEGDVVKDFVDACREKNMKFGFYLSPWDRHEAKYGCYDDEKKYDDFYTSQLTELLSEYADHDEVFEIWFDGAGSKGHTYDWEKIIGVCKKYQPGAMIFNMGKPTIRWVGNENGLASEANWNVMKVGESLGEMESESFDDIGMKLKECYGLGNVWMPAECDTSIRKTRLGAKHWFYHTNDGKSVLSIEDLIEIYFKSVGRGSNLLLNLPPNRDGLIPDLDAQRAAKFGEAVRKMFSDPIAITSGEGNSIKLELPAGQKVNCLMIEEDIKQGQRIREYELQIFEINQWKTVHKGFSVGHKKIDRLKSFSAPKVRIKVNNSFGEPVVDRFTAFNIGNF